MPFDYPKNEAKSDDYRFQNIHKSMDEVNRVTSKTAEMMMLDLVPAVEVAENMMKKLVHKGILQCEEVVEVIEVTFAELSFTKLYQREILASTVNRMGEFDPSLEQVLTVWVRPRTEDVLAKYIVTDGQHSTIRKWASLRVNGMDVNELKEEKVTVKVHYHSEDSSLAQCIKRETQHFNKLNSGRKNIGNYERYEAGLIYGDEESEEIHSMFEAMGVKYKRLGDPKGRRLKSLDKARDTFLMVDNSPNKTATIKAAKYVIDWYNKTSSSKEELHPALIGAVCWIYCHILKKNPTAPVEEIQAFLENRLPTIQPRIVYEKAAGKQIQIMTRRIMNTFWTECWHDEEGNPVDSKVFETVMNAAGLPNQDVLGIKDVGTLDI